MFRTFISIMMLILLATVVVGCEHREQLQLEVQHALAKQTEMNNYRFSGSANLHLEQPEGPSNSNPLTASLLTMIMNSQLNWEGVASVKPVQLELMLKLTPHSTSQSIDIPMLIQDNKMYLHIPAINEPEQYYEINLAELSDLSGTNSSLSADQLGNSTAIFSSIFQEIVGSIDPKRFDDASDKDSDLRSINITLNQKHVEEAIDIWFTAAPSILKQLKEASYIQTKAYESWSEQLTQADHRNWIERSNEITLNQPISLQTTIDDDGYVRESHIKADITHTDNQNNSKTWSIDMVNHYDDINQNPPFTQPAPTDIKSLSEILNLMSTKINP